MVGRIELLGWGREEEGGEGVEGRKGGGVGPEVCPKR